MRGLRQQQVAQRNPAPSYNSVAPKQLGGPGGLSLSTTQSAVRDLYWTVTVTSVAPGTTLILTMSN